MRASRRLGQNGARIPDENHFLSGNSYSSELRGILTHGFCRLLHCIYREMDNKGSDRRGSLYYRKCLEHVSYDC
jgi:hypothetical protein